MKNIIGKKVFFKTTILLITSFFFLLVFSSLFVLAGSGLASDSSHPFNGAHTIWCSEASVCNYWINQRCVDDNFDCFLEGDVPNCVGGYKRCDKPSQCESDSDCSGKLGNCLSNAFCNDNFLCQCNSVDSSSSVGSGDGGGDGSSGSEGVSDGAGESIDDNQGSNDGGSVVGEEPDPDVDPSCPWRSVVENKKERVFSIGSVGFYQDADGKVWQLPVISPIYNARIDNMGYFLLKQFYGEVFTLHRVPKLDGFISYNKEYSRRLFLFDDGNVYFGSLKYNGTYSDGSTKMKFNKGSKISFFSDVKQVITNSRFSSNRNLPVGLICTLSNNGNVSCITSYLARLNDRYKIILLDPINISLSNIKKIVPFDRNFVQKLQRDADGRYDSNKFYLDGFDALGFDGIIKRVFLNKTVTWNSENYDVVTKVVNISVMPVNDVFDMTYHNFDRGSTFLLINNSVKMVDYNFKKYNYRIAADNDGFVIGYDSVAKITDLTSSESVSPVITCDGHLKYSGDIGRGSYSNSGQLVYHPGIFVLPSAVFVGVPPLENITSINAAFAHYALSSDNNIYVWGGYPAGSYTVVITSPLKINYVLEED